LAAIPQTSDAGQTVGTAGTRALLWSGKSVAPVQLNPAGSSLLHRTATAWAGVKILPTPRRTAVPW